MIHYLMYSYHIFHITAVLLCYTAVVDTYISRDKERTFDIKHNVGVSCDITY